MYDAFLTDENRQTVRSTVQPIRASCWTGSPQPRASLKPPPPNCWTPACAPPSRPARLRPSGKR